MPSEKYLTPMESGYRGTEILGYRDTGINRYKDTGIHKCKDTEKQGYRETGINFSLFGSWIILIKCNSCSWI